MQKLEVIEARLRKLQKQAEALAKKESDKAIATIRQLMTDHGLSAADIDGHVGGKRRGSRTTTGSKKQAGIPRYRDPKTGATWTGHGRAPGWIASVKDRTRFLVSGSTPNHAASKPKRANGASAKGGGKPLSAPYRDPETGATWSGRGRAPEWIAGAKDRNPFRI